MGEERGAQREEGPLDFFAELKRRKVYKVAVGYAVVAWLFIQAASIFLPAFDAPGWMMKVVITGSVVGFPIALILAWAFELTPDGIVRAAAAPAPAAGRTGRKLTAFIAVAALLALGLFLLQIFRSAFEESARHDNASIAVLPLVNGTDDPDQEYFSDGLSEELINSLGDIRELRVIGRNSSFRFKGRAEDARTVGQALGVANLLEGSVRKADNRVRISVALVNAKDGSQRWSQTYDRELKDIFALQEEIAHSVADQLRVTLLGQRLKTTAEPSNQSLEAYNAYLQGEFYFAQFNLESTRRSIEFHREAIRLDPNYGKAYAALAWSLCRLGFLSGAEGRDAFVEARGMAARALGLNPNITLARSAAAYVSMNLDWDLAAAEKELVRATEIAPRDPTVKNTLANLRSYQLRRVEAGRLWEEAITLDPLNVIILANFAGNLRSLGRYEEAERVIRRTLELQPASAQNHYLLARIYLARGDLEAALREAELEPAGAHRRLGIALVQTARHDQPAADAALRDLIEHHAEDNPFRVAVAYAFRGEPDRVFEWLERARAARDPRVINTTSDDLLEPYHADPRFAAFCLKAGLTMPVGGE